MTWQKKKYTGGLLLGVSDKRSSSPKENRIFRKKKKKTKNKTKQWKEKKRWLGGDVCLIFLFLKGPRGIQSVGRPRAIFSDARTTVATCTNRLIPRSCRRHDSFPIVFFHHQRIVLWFVGLQGWDIFHEVALCYLLSTRARWRVRNASKWFPTSAISSRHLLCMSFHQGSIHHHSWVSVRNDSIMVVHTNTKTLSAFSMVLLLLLNANLYIV